jgi:LuxR family transcriptional regulator, maltose regulon positive regulatory protein
MPRVPLHALIWSREQDRYDLHTQGQLERRFGATEDHAWLAWLGEARSFAFHGATGSLNVYQEARPRGGRYWYAYHTIKGRTRKRYVGGTAHLTFARLEEVARALASESAPASPASSTPLPSAGQSHMPVSSRLAPPGLPHTLVERERLLALLDGALSTPLTLVSAAAGWGKTTLLTAWASRHRAHIAWLSLHELDTSPTRFWFSVITALRSCGAYAPDMGATVVDLLQSPQPAPLSTWLSTFLHELGSQAVDATPVVLIVDDYQLIGDQAIHEGMSDFLERLPQHLHVILSSREDPPVPLARWRVRGQLTEIRMANLRFSLEEAYCFLSSMLAPSPSDGEVQLLVNRTEGWIAGLHLAALALRQREDRAAFLRAFTGRQRYLLDYVQEDILASLATDVRDFLLQTAILSSLDASVCQAVTEAPNELACQQVLVMLERANLFLVPLDEERRSYLLHDLFREALLATLHATRPEIVSELHHRAAGFYAARGEWSEAITHCLAAENFSMAVCLMEQTAEQFWVRGEAAAMAQWVMRLPQPVVRTHANLVLTTALYLLNTVTQTTGDQRTRVRRQAQQLMAQVETALLSQEDEGGDTLVATPADGCVAPLPRPQAPHPADDAQLRQRLRLLHVFLLGIDATARGDHGQLQCEEQELEEELAQDVDPLWQMLPLALRFVLYTAVRAEGARLLLRLMDTKAQAERAGSRFVTIKAQQWLALAALQAGQLHLAYQESLAALDLIKHMSGYTLLEGYFELVLAQVLYQWNRLEEACGLLQKVLDTATSWQQLDLRAWCYAEQQRIALARREWPVAQRALQEMEHLMEREPYGRYLSFLPTMHAQGRLAQGQLREVATWAEGTAFPEDRWDTGTHGTFPVVIRLYLAQRRWQEAAELLARWSGHLDGPVLSVYTITYLAQSMVALHHTGRSEEAREVATRLFTLTRPEGYLRMYLDEGDPMRQTLQGLLTPHPGCEWQDPSILTYISTLLTAFAQQERDTKSSVMTASDRDEFENTTDRTLTPLSDESRGQPLAEPLTQREFDVLRLLVEHRSSPEIARTLYVEVNTVRTHVKHLYGKLGVHSRDQAVWRARELGLV